MTWCTNKFQTFSDAIKLDTARRERIDSAIQHLGEFIDNDEELSTAKSGAVFLQGSVATGTTVKPLEGDEFDVDLVYPFRLRAFADGTTSGQIFSWFESRFSGNDFYRPRLIEKDRCVRIDYAGDFHLDVTPATADIVANQPYAIATRNSAGWETSDPQGFVSWVKGIDSKADGADVNNVKRFIRCVRYMKRWRDEHFDAAAAPTSILLVTALGKHEPTVKSYNPSLQDSLYPQYSTDAAYLYDMIRLTYSCILAGRRSSFSHPTLGEDLSEGWADEHLDEFMTKLNALVETMNRAIYTQTEEASVPHYRQAFGNSFPN